MTCREKSAMIRIKSLAPLNSPAMSNSIEFYLKSIDRRWKKEIRQTNNEILLLSPYITSKTAELILETIKNKDLCKIYTVFSLENFMTGHSSIKTINHLSQRGYKLFHVHRLNANIILILNLFVSIGSQSLNRRGVKNKEANVIITDPKKVQKIHSFIQSWVSSGYIISQEMIDETEQALFSLRRKFCSLQRESAELEIQIRDHENRRRQQFILETMSKIFHIISELTEFINEEIDDINKRQKILNDLILKSKIASGREKVLKIANHQSIDHSLAEKCIKESAYWYEHILDENQERLPELLRNNRHLAKGQINSNIDSLKQKCIRNYKTAIPFWYPPESKIQLLLPLCLISPDKADLALVADKNKHEKVYRIRTALTMDMAYNNARLITRPDREWLNP
ncbi:MAG: DUF3825 domain-containing protein [Microcystaceae cyanobacterium]